ncbi:MAG: winged helix-turn-helix transcriptional regulator [Kordiimonadaceae bacterium]|nr:winged helix-turn-helix transcriptional regulator [Porticoccaceae bacterium]MBL4839101.1 winged helix-turn-helix transcriptional regulator [Kordiimonadaceae bacterium]
MKPLDKIDRNILETLQDDGRISNVELARLVNLSPTPCLERVRRLEKSGYIKGYRAELCADKMKAGFVTFITVSLDRTTEDVFENFAEQIAHLDEIVECHMVGGGFDYILKIRTETMAAFRGLIFEKLSNLPHISQTHSYFVMEEVKCEKSLKIPDTA